MWLDIMSSYTTLPINIKLANMLGLDVAVYVAELLNIYPRVVVKKKEELLENEGYFELDRDYITKRTTLKVEDQLRIDTGLNKLEILSYRENDLNWIRLDVEKLCSYLVEDDIKAIHEIQRVSKLRREDTANAKRASVRLNLLAVLTETDPDVLTAYKTWIDAMLEAKKPLTRAAIEIYQRNLNDYTDVKEVKIKILEIATSLAYHEFAWARDQYEKNYAKGGAFLGTRQKRNGGIDPNSGF
jgi:hypothetical protein